MKTQAWNAIKRAFIPVKVNTTRESRFWRGRAFPSHGSQNAACGEINRFLAKNGWHESFETEQKMNTPPPYVLGMNGALWHLPAMPPSTLPGWRAASGLGLPVLRCSLEERPGDSPRTHPSCWDGVETLITKTGPSELQLELKGLPRIAVKDAIWRI